MTNSENKQDSYTVSVGEDGIVHIGLHGPVEDDDLDRFQEWANDTHQCILSVHSSTGQKVKCLVDVRGLSGYSVEAFDIMRDLITSNREYMDKTATYGGNKFMKFAQDAVTALTGRDNIRGFETKEEALAWLSEDSLA